MSKICTDLEQSRKLLSLGIDKNTADMHYFSDGYNPTKLDVGYSAEMLSFIEVLRMNTFQHGA